MSEQSKCPFTGAGTPPKHPTGRGTSNRDWWPNNLNLKMKISDVEYQGDGNKITFYYTADERVDFRELIKVFA